MPASLDHRLDMVLSESPLLPAIGTLVVEVSYGSLPVLHREVARRTYPETSLSRVLRPPFRRCEGLALFGSLWSPAGVALLGSVPDRVLTSRTSVLAPYLGEFGMRFSTPTCRAGVPGPGHYAAFPRLSSTRSTASSRPIRARNARRVPLYVVRVWADVGEPVADGGTPAQSLQLAGEIRIEGAAAGGEDPQVRT